MSKGEEKMQSILEKVRVEGIEIGIEQGKEEGIEEGIEIGIERGKEEGIEQGIEKTTIAMLQRNLPDEMILEITGISEEKLKELKEKI